MALSRKEERQKEIEKLQVHKDKVLEVLKGLDSETAYAVLQDVQSEIFEKSIKPYIL